MRNNNLRGIGQQRNLTYLSDRSLYRCNISCGDICVIYNPIIEIQTNDAHNFHIAFTYLFCKNLFRQANIKNSILAHIQGYFIFRA